MLRVLVYVWLVTTVFCPISGNTSEAGETRYTYVIVHGAAGGGWAWKAVDDLLSSFGHVVYRPTLTGLGEKVHLASADIGLDTHINDVANLIRFEDLRDVVLVGHSYGGMVITGVMNLMPERIGHGIFLDAAVPDDGMAGTDVWKSALSRNNVEDGQIHFPWIDDDAPYPRDVPQSLKTFTQPVSYKNPKALALPVTYIGFVHPGQTVNERAMDPSWKRAETRHWTIRTLASDHNAHQSHPNELVELLRASPMDRNNQKTN